MENGTETIKCTECGKQEMVQYQSVLDHKTKMLFCSDACEQAWAKKHTGNYSSSF